MMSLEPASPSLGTDSGCWLGLRVATRVTRSVPACLHLILVLPPFQPKAGIIQLLDRKWCVARGLWRMQLGGGGRCPLWDGDKDVIRPVDKGLHFCAKSPLHFCLKLSAKPCSSYGLRPHFRLPVTRQGSLRPALRLCLWIAMSSNCSVVPRWKISQRQ